MAQSLWITFRNKLAFCGGELFLDQPPSWKITPCWLLGLLTQYIHSDLPYSLNPRMNDY